MQKILLSILLSISLSLIFGISIDRVIKKDWKMELSYDHIGRNLDVDFTVLDSYIKLKSAEKFNDFVSRLDRQISFIGNQNPCSLARGQSANPLILVKNQKLNLKITMLGKNKNLLLKCEEFIDTRIKRYETVLIKTAKLLSDKNFIRTDEKSEENFELKKYEAQKFFKNNLLEFINKENLSLEDGYSESNILKMEELAKNLMLIDLLEKNRFGNTEILSFDFDKITVIKKVYRDLSLKEQNSYLLFFSVFIIFQVFFILILFRKDIFYIKNLRRNFKKLI